jgi:two-component system sensor kinase FixL
MAAAEAIGKNVNILMPSPYHERHDGYIQHSLDPDERRIIGKGDCRRPTSERKHVFTVLSVGEARVKGGAVSRRRRRFTGIERPSTQRRSVSYEMSGRVPPGSSTSR